MPNKGSSKLKIAPDLPHWSVEDYQHPAWCDHSLCDPDSSSRGAEPGGQHISSGARVGLQSWEAEALVQLVHSDDFLDGQNHGTTHVRLQVANHAWMADSPGHDFLAIAHLEPTEARMLAATLNVYADRADQDQSGEHGVLMHPVADLPTYLS